MPIKRNICFLQVCKNKTVNITLLSTPVFSFTVCVSWIQASMENVSQPSYSLYRQCSLAIIDVSRWLNFSKLIYFLSYQIELFSLDSFIFSDKGTILGYFSSSGFSWHSRFVCYWHTALQHACKGVLGKWRNLPEGVAFHPPAVLCSWAIWPRVPWELKTSPVNFHY